MTPNNFIFWLHGFFEISESNSLSEKQVQVIKDHLDLCFNKVTPDRSNEEWVQPYFEREHIKFVQNLPITGITGMSYDSAYYYPITKPYCGNTEEYTGVKWTAFTDVTSRRIC